MDVPITSSSGLNDGLNEVVENTELLVSLSSSLECFRCCSLPILDTASDGEGDGGRCRRWWLLCDD